MILSFRCKLISVVVSMLAFFALSASGYVFGFTEADARSAIVAAENRVVDCYTAVLDAEEAGANVTGLLRVLNEAGELLSWAKLTYSAGDFDSALDFAVRSQEKLNGIVAETDLLRKTAAQQRYWDFMFNVAGSFVGTGLVVCGGFVVWFLLKRKYDETEEMH